MKEELSEFIRHKKERGIVLYDYVSRFSKINDYIAIIMQNIPQYHGSYSKIMQYKNKTLAVSDGRGQLSGNPPQYEINPDFINPVGALILDRFIIKQIMEVSR